MYQGNKKKYPINLCAVTSVCWNFIHVLLYEHFKQRVGMLAVCNQATVTYEQRGNCHNPYIQLLVESRGSAIDGTAVCPNYQFYQFIICCTARNTTPQQLPLPFTRCLHDQPVLLSNVVNSYMLPATRVLVHKACNSSSIILHPNINAFLGLHALCLLYRKWPRISVGSDVGLSV